jgi:hypothetical protein
MLEQTVSRENVDRTNVMAPKKQSVMSATKNMRLAENVVKHVFFFTRQNKLACLSLQNFFSKH